jgi:hypothetical protein
MNYEYVSLQFKPKLSSNFLHQNESFLDIGIRGSSMYKILYADELSAKKENESYILYLPRGVSISTNNDAKKYLKLWLDATQIYNLDFLMLIVDPTVSPENTYEVVKSIINRSRGIKSIYSVFLLPEQNLDPATIYFSSSTISNLMNFSEIMIPIDSSMLKKLTSGLLNKGKRIYQEGVISEIANILYVMRNQYRNQLEYIPLKRRLLGVSLIYNLQKEVFGKAENVYKLMKYSKLLSLDLTKIIYSLSITGTSEWNEEELQEGLNSFVRTERANLIYAKAIVRKGLSEALFLFDISSILPSKYCYLIATSKKFAQVIGKDMHDFTDEFTGIINMIEGCI